MGELKMDRRDNDTTFRKAINVDDIITKQEGLEVIKPEIRRKKHTGIRPTSDLPKAVRQEIARKGSEVCNEKRQAANSFKEAFEMLADIVLNLDSDQDAIKLLETYGVKPTERQIIAFRQMQLAKSDTKSFVAVRDTMGEKPVEVQEITDKRADIGEIYKKWATDIENKE